MFAYMSIGMYVQLFGQCSKHPTTKNHKLVTLYLSVYIYKIQVALDESSLNLLVFLFYYLAEVSTKSEINDLINDNIVVMKFDYILNFLVTLSYGIKNSINENTQQSLHQYMTHFLCYIWFECKTCVLCFQ